jgi:hypothetical protein
MVRHLFFIHAAMPLLKPMRPRGYKKRFEPMSINEQQTRRSVTSTGYNLSLSDGNQLHLSADEPLRPWLDKFAAIMKLNKTSFNCKPKLTYFLNSIP